MAECRKGGAIRSGCAAEFRPTRTTLHIGPLVLLVKIGVPRPGKSDVVMGVGGRIMAIGGAWGQTVTCVKQETSSKTNRLAAVGRKPGNRGRKDEAPAPMGA